MSQQNNATAAHASSQGRGENAHNPDSPDGKPKSSPPWVFEVASDSTLPERDRIALITIRNRIGSNATTWRLDQTLADDAGLSLKKMTAAIASLKQRGHIRTIDGVNPRSRRPCRHLALVPPERRQEAIAEDAARRAKLEPRRAKQRATMAKLEPDRAKVRATKSGRIVADPVEQLPPGSTEQLPPGSTEQLPLGSTPLLPHGSTTYSGAGVPPTPAGEYTQLPHGSSHLNSSNELNQESDQGTHPGPANAGCVGGETLLSVQEEEEEEGRKTEEAQEQEEDATSRAKAIADLVAWVEAKTKTSRWSVWVEAMAFDNRHDWLKALVEDQVIGKTPNLALLNWFLRKWKAEGACEPLERAKRGGRGGRIQKTVELTDEDREFFGVNDYDRTWAKIEAKRPGYARPIDYTPEQAAALRRVLGPTLDEKYWPKSEPQKYASQGRLSPEERALLEDEPTSTTAPVQAPASTTTATTITSPATTPAPPATPSEALAAGVAQPAARKPTAPPPPPMAPELATEAAMTEIELDPILESVRPQVEAMLPGLHDDLAKALRWL